MEIDQTKFFVYFKFNQAVKNEHIINDESRSFCFVVFFRLQNFSFFASLVKANESKMVWMEECFWFFVCSSVRYEESTKILCRISSSSLVFRFSPSSTSLFFFLQHKAFRLCLTHHLICISALPSRLHTPPHFFLSFLGPRTVLLCHFFSPFCCFLLLLDCFCSCSWFQAEHRERYRCASETWSNSRGARKQEERSGDSSTHKRAARKINLWCFDLKRQITEIVFVEVEEHLIHAIYPLSFARLASTTATRGVREEGDANI